MPKGKKSTETKQPEAMEQPETPAMSPGSFERSAVVGLPRFNPHVRPVATGEQVSTVPVRQRYESIQEEAKGPGTDEWKRADQLRANLSATYQSLKEDDRYAPEYKSQRVGRVREGPRSN